MFHIFWRCMLIIAFSYIWLCGCGGEGKVKAPTAEFPESPEQESPVVPEQPEMPYVTPGTEKWKVQVVGEATARPVLGSDGIVYAGTSAGYVYAISPEGEIRWHKDLSGSIRQIQSLIFDDEGRIYFGASKQYASGFYLYALDAEAYGEELWHVKASPYSWRSGVVMGQGGTVYAGQYGFAPDGTERWHHEHQEYAVEVVNVGVVDGEDVIYAMRFDKSWLYSLASDGTERWHHYLPGVESVTLAPDGTIYAVSIQGVLYATHPEDGSEQWRVSLGGRVRDRNQVIVDEYGAVYAGTYTPAAVVATSSDGTEIWRFSTESEHDRQPMLTLDPEGIFYATIGVHLYAIHTDDGTEAWSIEMDGYSAGVTLGPEDVLYFGTSRGYVYAVTR